MSPGAQCRSGASQVAPAVGEEAETLPKPRIIIAQVDGSGTAATTPAVDAGIARQEVFDFDVPCPVFRTPFEPMSVLAGS